MSLRMRKYKTKKINTEKEMLSKDPLIETDQS